LVMTSPWFGRCRPPPATTRDLFIDGCSLMAENANWKEARLHAVRISMSICSGH